MFNQFNPDEDFPIPPVKDDDDESSPSNSFWRPLPRPLRIDIADRFVVIPIGANAVATYATTESNRMVQRVLFILIDGD